ncbi:MAG: HAD-IA family hydrolase [Halofilum sp. (in: g-proteobacteria)]|nr:HAD-IA family hydrolase [Halofilum sp. (in: g-proteobacteria)]
MNAATLIDLDGTLCDSVPELAGAVDRVLEELGYPAAGVAKVRDWVGEGIATLLARALRDATGEEPSAEALRDARTRFDTAYAEVLGTMCPLYPGVVEGLDRLRAAGVRTACITNKARLFALPLLGSLGVADRFDALVAGDAGLALKPDPAMLLAAAERLDVAIGDCVMIGDSAVDVAAARPRLPAWCGDWLQPRRVDRVDGSRRRYLTASTRWSRPCWRGRSARGLALGRERRSRAKPTDPPRKLRKLCPAPSMGDALPHGVAPSIIDPSNALGIRSCRPSSTSGGSWTGTC